jgi:hypothetical protein
VLFFLLKIAVIYSFVNFKSGRCSCSQKGIATKDRRSLPSAIWFGSNKWEAPGSVDRIELRGIHTHAGLFLTDAPSGMSLGCWPPKRHLRVPPGADRHERTVSQCNICIASKFYMSIASNGMYNLRHWFDFSRSRDT